MFIKWGSEGYLIINKGDIQDVLVEKSFLSNKIAVVLSDASRHIFNYGALRVDKLANAIKSQ